MTLLHVDRLVKTFPRGGGVFARGRERFRAVDEVSFTLDRGRRLGVVGESGSGKTTLGRTVLGLFEPDEGTVKLGGVDLHRAPRPEREAARRRMQMIFQDNASALDPRLRIGAAVAEPLRVAGLGANEAERGRRVLEWLERVGLDATLARRFSHELSGGQRQRVGIARALVVEPDLLIADEPVASLDVSIQTQILKLLLELVEQTGVALLFISHDLRVVRALTEHVLVMYRGRPVEYGPTTEVIARPLHAYTQSLVAAIPALHPDRRRILAGPPPVEHDPTWLPEPAAWREIEPGRHVLTPR